MNASNMLLSSLVRVVHGSKAQSNTAVAASGATDGPQAPRGLATALLAGVVATLVVMADQLIDTWSNGHLLAAWVLLWVVIFGVMALLAGHISLLVSSAARAWSEGRLRRAKQQELARQWAFARNDPHLFDDMFGEDNYTV